MFFKKQIVYVDKLHDYRILEILDFKLFDRIFIEETIAEFEANHPSYPYAYREVLKRRDEWVIVWKWVHGFYSEDTKSINFEWWRSLTTYSSKIRYETDFYIVVNKEWILINAKKVKKHHWEFQETFNHMELLELKRKEVLDAQNLYAKNLDEMSKILDEWRKLQKEMVVKLNK